MAAKAASALPDALDLGLLRLCPASSADTVSQRVMTGQGEQK